ncbi:hypothetical protein tb265_27560 [Gemmatimonadetes bacterium T265]|nr:hypothetical protein tb265_27560 [Gemmatimonadetes bacterium T265]
MSKRVDELAGDLKVGAEDVLSLLRAMEIPVARGPQTVLSDDQISRVRARWEREKRTRAVAAAQAAAPAPSRRRKPAPEPVAIAPEPPAAAGVRRRARPADAEPASAVVVEDAPPGVIDEIAPEPTAVAENGSSSAPEPSPAAVDDSVRDIIPVAAGEQAERVRAEGERVDRERAERERGDRERADRERADRERADRERAELDAVRAAAQAADAAAARRERPQAAVSPPPRIIDRPANAPTPRPTVPAPSPATPRPAPVATASPSAVPLAAAPNPAPDAARPRPIVPGAPRPRPITPGSPRNTPVASASPAAPRRDERRGPGAGTPTFGSPFVAAPGAPGAARGGRGGKKGKRGVDQGAVADNIRNTLQGMRGAPTRGGRRRDDDGREELEAARAAEAQRERTTVRVNEFITVSELAGILKVPPTQIVGFALKNLGLMVTINQRLDFDQIDLIASEFGFQAVREEEYAADLAAEPQDAETEADLTTRPPVVTIMGHVDHGKTSLLDYVRKANVVAGEAGGITQHIGAYHVSLPNKRQITFLDTPGHEAFTAMRARGAQVTDIVVLVVAADDGLMPQTIEAISHARNAGVPMIVAINKIDLPQANPLRVKQELLQQNVVLEDFGGTVLSTEISAKLGTNVDDLLEQILLQADLLELRANADRRATGAVIEAQLDPGKGPVATVLVQNGTLRVGNDFICGMYSGRVRALLDERGKPVKGAGPAIPVQVLGLTGVPMAGDQFLEVDDATQAREIAQRRERLDREAKSRRTSKSAVTLEEFMKEAPVGEKRNLKLLIKADQGGPAEALADALGQLSTGEVAVEIVQRGVGAITEGDILLAKAAGAIIIGFHVRPDTKARTAAEREGVDIKLYRIIYEAVNDVRAALEGLLAPEQREVVLGEAEVRELFKVPRVGTIAGSAVRSGTFTRGSKVRVIRDGVEVYDGNLSSLRRFKDDVREVQAGFECGIGVENFNDLKVGDVIECYRTDQVARTLVQASAAAS